MAESKLDNVEDAVEEGKDKLGGSSNGDLKKRSKPEGLGARCKYLLDVPRVAIATATLYPPLRVLNRGNQVSSVCTTLEMGTLLAIPSLDHGGASWRTTTK